MPRPRNRRRIRGIPRTNYFKPAGIGVSELEVITLERDEFEAIRLKDWLGKNQDETAKEMKVSQPTLHRILSGARKKISKAIVEGKAIKIQNN